MDMEDLCMLADEQMNEDLEDAIDAFIKVFKRDPTKEEIDDLKRNVGFGDFTGRLEGLVASIADSYELYD